MKLEKKDKIIIGLCVVTAILSFISLIAIITFKQEIGYQNLIPSYRGFFFDIHPFYNYPNNPFGAITVPL